jgi:hypothetical protein
METISLTDVKKNAQVRAYISEAGKALYAQGFTEHSFEHAIRTANTGGDILKT